MIGLIEESGRFPGFIEFAEDGIKPKAFVEFGTEKSFIALFIMMPVSGTMSCEPNGRLTVLVSDTAMPDASEIAT